MTQITDGQQVPLRGRGSIVHGYATVDAEDYERITAHRWHRVASKGNTYARRYDGADAQTGKQRYVWMHREILALGDFDGTAEIDHEDGDGLNNRRSNLIVSDRVRNSQTRRKIAPASSTHRGVCWVGRTGRWQAQVRVDGRRIYLGQYMTESEAADAARAGRRTHLPHSRN